MSVRYILNRDAVASSGMGAEIVLLDLRTSTYLAVSTGAAVLWTRLTAGPASQQDLAGALSSAFGIEPGTAATDTEEFLDDLLARGFIVKEDPDDGPG